MGFLPLSSKVLPQMARDENPKDINRTINSSKGVKIAVT
jgi:hypothetical protein